MAILKKQKNQLSESDLIKFYSLFENFEKNISLFQIRIEEYQDDFKKINQLSENQIASLKRLISFYEEKIDEEKMNKRFLINLFYKLKE